ncbi:MAG: adenosylcobinamide-GDP ribazoletransferase [Desulfotalea sp.]
MEKFLTCIQKLCIAFRFLTILPITWRADKDGDYFATVSIFFPIVGLVIGLIAFVFTSFTSSVFPQQVLAALLVLFYGAISGFLHIDGLADSFDGLFSSRPKERMLEIMRDSATGAMGVVGIVSVLLLKYSALASMPIENLLAACFFIPIGGRVALLIVMGYQKYARKEGGLGKTFYSDKSKREAQVVTVVLFVLISLFSLPIAIKAICFMFLGLFFFMKLCDNKIGGATGDTMGASSEIVEMLVALAFACA